LVGIEPASDGLRGARYTASCGQDLAGTEQSLAGHASPIRTLTADQLLLDQGGGKPSVGTPANRMFTRGASAEDNYVESFCHFDHSCSFDSAVSGTASTLTSSRPRLRILSKA
jgi:hypothetical protein